MIRIYEVLNNSAMTIGCHLQLCGCFSSKEKHLQNNVSTSTLTAMEMSLLCANISSMNTLKCFLLLQFNF